MDWWVIAITTVAWAYGIINAWRAYKLEINPPITITEPAYERALVEQIRFYEEQMQRQEERVYMMAKAIAELEVKKAPTPVVVKPQDLTPQDAPADEYNRRVKR